MGTFVTNNEPIPADRTNAPGYSPATTNYELDAIYFNSISHGVDDIRTALNGLVRENLLPNTQWQVATAIGSNTKRNPQGTGTSAVITVTGYTTGGNTVTFTTTGNGPDLKVGDLILISGGGADSNLTVCCIRVDTIADSTHFTGSLPNGRTASVSGACTAALTGCGGASSVGTGDAFDGWSKAVNGQVWREDNAINLKSGSKYSCGYLQSGVSPEQLSVSIPARDVSKFAGKPVAMGAWVYHKIHAGAGTWKSFISSNGTGGTTTYSAAGTAGAYDWKEVTAAIPTDATSVNFGIEFQGTTNDVFYVSQPIAGRGSWIGHGNYVSPARELLQPKVKISPLSYLGASLAQSSWLAPNAANDVGVWVRPFPETNGAIAPTVRCIKMQLEGRCDSIFSGIGVRNNDTVPHIYAILMYSSVAGQQPSYAGEVTLNDNGDCFLYSAATQVNGTSITFTNASSAVVGVGTKFTTELAAGMLIQPSGGSWYTIQTITDDTHLTLSANFTQSTIATGGYKTKVAWYSVSFDWNGYVL